MALWRAGHLGNTGIGAHTHGTNPLDLDRAWVCAGGGISRTKPLSANPCLSSEVEWRLFLASLIVAYHRTATDYANAQNIHQRYVFTKVA